jgi:hypothetical protein
MVVSLLSYLLLFASFVGSKCSQESELSVSIDLMVTVKLLGISSKDIPLDKLKSAILSISTARLPSTQDRASFQINYDVGTAPVSYLHQFESFLKENPLDSDSYIRVNMESLLTFLENWVHESEADSLGFVEAPSINSMTVVVLHSDTLPRHLIYKDSPSSCIQSVFGSFAFLDMSAKSCPILLPLSLSSGRHVEFHTPLFHHPWPGTFSHDEFTRWSPLPTSDIIAHRTARVSAVVHSAVRAFSVANVNRSEIRDTEHIFIPLIYIHNGDSSSDFDTPLFSTSDLNDWIRHIVLPTQKVTIWPVSHHAGDIAAVSIAMSKSQRYKSSIVRLNGGAEFKVEAPYIDAEALWKEIQLSVSRIVSKLLQTEGLSSTYPTIPIVILSDFHFRPESAENGVPGHIQPLFSNKDFIYRSSSGAILGLHSSDKSVKWFDRDDYTGIGWWALMPTEDLNGLIAACAARGVSNLEAPHLQTTSVDGVIDTTWMNGRHVLGNSPGNFQFVAWSRPGLLEFASIRTMLISKIETILKSSHDAIKLANEILDKMNRLSQNPLLLKSEEDLISQDSRYSQWNFSFPPKIEKIIEIIRNDRAKLFDQALHFASEFESKSNSSLSEINEHINLNSAFLRYLANRLEVSLSDLDGYLRRGRISLTDAVSKSKDPASRRYQSWPFWIVLYKGLPVLGVLALFLFVLQQFQKFVEKQAKKND